MPKIWYILVYMKGFTLIELLIVIAIIGIISGIVISSISGSVDDAQGTADKFTGVQFSARQEKCNLFGENKLYMTGQNSDSLYELNTEASGRSPATKIGISFGFPNAGGRSGRQEGTPRSITSHNGKFYMVGSGSDSLYELNTEASGDPATKIGTTFGVQNGEYTPVSITSHNGKLYMVGQTSDSLYVLDTEATGNPARRIGTGFGLGGSGQESTPVSITSHNGKLYMLGDGSDSLYVLDTEATGDPATKIGTGFGLGGSGQENTPISITSHKGKLYMIGRGNDSLYILDTEATGKSPATRIGTSFGSPEMAGLAFTNQELTPESIISHNGKLYMTGSWGDSLYELNTGATGSPAKRIGTKFDGMEINPRSIASHCGL